jgi:hypothetical protein
MSDVRLKRTGLDFSGFTYTKKVIDQPNGVIKKSVIYRLEDTRSLNHICVEVLEDQDTFFRYSKDPSMNTLFKGRNFFPWFCSVDEYYWDLEPKGDKETTNLIYDVFEEISYRELYEGTDRIYKSGDMIQSSASGDVFKILAIVEITHESDDSPIAKDYIPKIGEIAFITRNVRSGRKNVSHESIARNTRVSGAYTYYDFHPFKDGFFRVGDVLENSTLPKTVEILSLPENAIDNPDLYNVSVRNVETGDKGGLRYRDLFSQKKLIGVRTYSWNLIKRGEGLKVEYKAKEAEREQDEKKEASKKETGKRRVRLYRRLIGSPKILQLIDNIKKGAFHYISGGFDEGKFSEHVGTLLGSLYSHVVKLLKNENVSFGSRVEQAIGCLMNNHYLFETYDSLKKCSEFYMDYELPEEEIDE